MRRDVNSDHHADLYNHGNIGATLCSLTSQERSVGARMPLWAFIDFRNLVTPRCQDQFAGVHNQNPPKACK